MSDSTQEFLPTWSPDGQQVAFISGWGGSQQVFIVSRHLRRGWSGRRQLTHEPSADVTRRSGAANFPRWSPDGKWISYITWGVGSTTFALGNQLRLIAPSGGSPRTLLSPRELGGPIRFAAWGRDSRVVYVHALAASGGSTFWSVPLSGGSPRLLLRLDDPARVPRRQEFATDGRRLFFTLAADESDIWVMHLKR